MAAFIDYCSMRESTYLKQYKCVNPYTVVANYHNQACDFFFNNFSASYQEKDLIELSVVSFLNVIKGKIKYSSIETKTLTAIISNILYPSHSSALMKINSKVLIQSNLFSRTQLFFIRQIILCLDNNETDSISCQNRLKGIEKDIIFSHLSLVEKAPLLIATAIGISSVNYWANFFWQREAAGVQTPAFIKSGKPGFKEWLKGAWRRIKEVVKSDLIGGLFGSGLAGTISILGEGASVVFGGVFTTSFILVPAVIIGGIFAVTSSLIEANP